MSCHTPVSISQTGGPFGGPQIVPCGRCLGCSLDYARMWTVRCWHESHMHAHNWFFTLTIDDDHLHRSSDDALPSLDPQHLVLFWKRLRKAGHVFSYFACGEYGDNTLRPHYHAIVFGLGIPDLKPLTSGLSSSDYINRHWRLGMVSIGMLSPERVAYCCGYATKKVLGPPRQWFYDRGLYHEFTRMSRNPAIGKRFYRQYLGDIYGNDSCLLPGGFSAKVPRYYDKLLDTDNPLELREIIKPARMAKAMENYSENIGFRFKAKVTVARSKFFLRSLKRTKKGGL